MSRFFVGQRVRLARPLNPKNKGWEGRVVYVGAVATGQEIGGFRMKPVRVCNCAVLWDQSGFTHPQCTDQLEPIQPEGSQPSEFTTLHDLLTSLEGVAA
jgi:hypothetical protein